MIYPLRTEPSPFNLITNSRPKHRQFEDSFECKTKEPNVNSIYIVF